MKIRTSIDLVANAYHVTVEIPALSVLEQELIAQFGEPPVATGGSFSGSATRPGDGAPTSTSFTLAERDCTIPTEFPVKQVFSLDDFADADVRATVFGTTIASRISAARTTLLAKDPNFIGETVTTL
jgi:hypothetical protein